MRFIVEFKVNVQDIHSKNSWHESSLIHDVEEWDVVSSVKEDLKHLVMEASKEIGKQYETWYHYQITNIEVQL